MRLWPTTDASCRQKKAQYIDAISDHCHMMPVPSCRFVDCDVRNLLSPEAVEEESKCERVAKIHQQRLSE